MLNEAKHLKPTSDYLMGVKILRLAQDDKWRAQHRYILFSEFCIVYTNKSPPRKYSPELIWRGMESCPVQKENLATIWHHGIPG